MVYWRCTRFNSGIEKEIGISKVVRSSFAPVWSDASFSILVPKEPKTTDLMEYKSLSSDKISDELLDEWGNVQVRIEVWDSKPDMVAKGKYKYCIRLLFTQVRICSSNYHRLISGMHCSNWVGTERSHSKEICRLS